MGEPLKNKESNTQIATPNAKIFYKEDIRLAVEWLKEQMIIRANDKDFKAPKNVPMFNLIDEAFPDVKTCELGDDFCNGERHYDGALHCLGECPNKNGGKENENKEK